MKKTYSILALLTMAIFGLSLAACDDGEDLDTNQYSSKSIALNSFGPCPVLRGGTLYFYGSNLDRIVEVQLPSADPITDIDVISSGTHSSISITVPEEDCDTGKVVLVADDGTTLTSVTSITYREDIVFDEFYVGQSGNLEGNVGDLLTIEGDYLNLMYAVIFTGEDTVYQEEFVTHDRYTIEVYIPAGAQTGTITLSDLGDTPNELESSEELIVTLPTVSGLSNSNPKAGEEITITGTDLDQITSVEFSGVSVDAADFISQTSTSITLTLPDTAEDGDVSVITQSGVEIEVGTITTVVPSNLSTSPDPVKNGGTITITGEDLDIVTSISFNNADGSIATQTETEITATVPDEAQTGDLTLTMANGNTVSVAYTLVEPTVTSFVPESLMAGEDLVIRGTDLDLVASVTFPTDQTVDAADFSVQTTSVISLTVPSAAQGEGATLNLTNGSSVEVTGLTIESSTNPTMTNSPSGYAGEEVTIEGQNYNNVETVYIGDTKVTNFTDRTSTSMTFTIPESLSEGEYDVILYTYDGSSYTVGTITINATEIDITQGNCVTQSDQSVESTFPMTLTWDDSGRFRVLRSSPVDLSSITWTAGVSLIRVYKDSSTTGQAQINDGNWSTFFTLSDWVGGEEILEGTLTEDMISWLTGESSDGWSDTAIIIQGDGLYVTKVTLVP